MARNNSERMGGARKSNSSPASSGVDQSGDGPLSFSTPTEFVELPSEGAFYGEGHPLQGETHIEIRHMTAKLRKRFMLEIKMLSWSRHELVAMVKSIKLKWYAPLVSLIRKQSLI